MKQKQFRMDNTEGYNQDDLDQLNKYFEKSLSKLKSSDFNYEDSVKNLSERILNDFDHEVLPRI